MGIRTYGTMAVDWEQRADFDRLRRERLARASAELAAVIADGAFWELDAPVKRAGAMDVPVPFSPVLEDQTVPTGESVYELAKGLVRR